MPGLISQATIEQIRAASDIVEVIGGYFPLKRAGANFTALCPFHKEKTPSFNVHPGKQIFHCFGCHKGGDVFRFVQDYENIGFLDSAKRLAERAGIVLEFEQSPEHQRKREIKETLRQLHEQLTARWHAVLLNDAAGEPARAYLQRRGVSDEAIRQFRLGYAPDDWEDTLRWGRSKKYDPTLLEQAGVAIRKEGADRRYGRFRGRLMFPIGDEQGRVIGFSGRVLDADAKGAKYVNSPETPLFHKGSIIYGLHLARRAMLDAGNVLVCEGQLDLIACHMAGIANVVAPQGTALTADQARVLKRYAGEVILCFDADTAGQNAMARSLDVLLEAGLAIRVLALPSGEDPDSCLRSHGPDRFRERLDAAEGFFDFHLRCLCEEHDPRTDRGHRAVLQAMGAALRKADDAVLMDRYTQHTALALGVSAEAVRAEFRKVKAPRAPVASEGEAPSLPATPPPPHEAWLLRLLFHEAVQAEWMADELDEEWVEHAGVREILRRWREAPEPIGGAALLAELPAAAAALLSSAMAEGRDIPEPNRQLADLVTRLRNQHLDRELVRVNQQLAQQGLDESTQRRLLAEQGALRERKQQPLARPADAA